jgi:hypothetical protein
LVRLQHELERAALGAKPAPGAAAQREGQAVLRHGGLAVLPGKVEQRRLLDIEPGAGDRLDLGRSDRLERGLHPLVALERIGRDLVGQTPRIDRAEVGDHHDR